VNLFDWDDGEVKELEKLTAASEARHTSVDIGYLSELLYAMSIESKENISSNPGCEWQLKYFGKQSLFLFTKLICCNLKFTITFSCL
jgi:hypothetical protein